MSNIEIEAVLNIRFETKPFTLKPREYPEVLRILKELLATSSHPEPKCYTPRNFSWTFATLTNNFFLHCQVMMLVQMEV